MKHLGQHFLKNKSVLEKTVSALALQAGDTLIEIGPGHGELTREIIKENGGVKIFAIEKDAELAKELRENFKNDSGVRILEGDALKLIPEFVSENKFENYKLAGNIPYYITGFLFRILGELIQKPDLSVIMLQKEVAERVADKPPRMNRLAASVGFWAEPKILFPVPRSNFSPPPRVDSAVILLNPRPEKGDKEAYYSLVRALFKQPRKTISNNLRDSGLPNTEAALKKLGINPQDRPQNLDIQNIIALSSTLKISA